MKIFSKDLFKTLGVSLSIVAISSCGNNNLIPNENCKSEELKGGNSQNDEQLKVERWGMWNILRTYLVEKILILRRAVL